MRAHGRVYAEDPVRNKHLNFQAERGHRILRRIKIKNALEQAYNFPLPPLHFDLFSRNTLKEEDFFFLLFKEKIQLVPVHSPLSQGGITAVNRPASIPASEVKGLWVDQ